MFNKVKNLKIIREAQNLTVLCLSFMIVVISIGQTSAYAQAPVYNNDAAQTEIRLQQMETQIRELTGKAEEQLYEINSLKQKIDMLEKMTEEPVAQTQVQPQPALAPAKRENVMNVVTPKPAANNKGENPSLNLDFKPAIQQETSLKGGDAAAQYEAAYTQLRLRQYDEAEASFKTFIATYKDNILAANAHYWLGESYYVRGNYSEAARAFAKGFQAYPDSAKSPDMLLKLGMSLKGMNKPKQACVALSQLPIKFPGGPQPVLQLAEKQSQDLSCGSNNE